MASVVNRCNTEPPSATREHSSKGHMSATPAPVPVLFHTRYSGAPFAVADAANTTSLPHSRNSDTHISIDPAMATTVVTRVAVDGISVDANDSGLDTPSSVPSPEPRIPDQPPWAPAVVSVESPWPCAATVVSVESPWPWAWPCAWP